MNRKSEWMIVLFLVVSLLVGVSHAGNRDVIQPTTRDTNMNEEARNLPFGLSAADLNNVEIMYGFYSAKTGAGKQELTVFGSGKVTLYLTNTRGAAPEIRAGQLHPNVVIGLLDFLADQGFLGFEDHYPSEHDPHVRRVLKLVLPSQTKTVMLDTPGFPAFEMVAGATKFAASLALPETLNRRFFPNL